MKKTILILIALVVIQAFVFADTSPPNNFVSVTESKNKIIVSEFAETQKIRIVRKETLTEVALFVRKNKRQTVGDTKISTLIFEKVFYDLPPEIKTKHGKSLKSNRIRDSGEQVEKRS
jgi:hypothetical protein